MDEDLKIEEALANRALALLVKLGVRGRVVKQLAPTAAYFVAVEDVEALVGALEVAHLHSQPVVGSSLDGLLNHLDTAAGHVAEMTPTTVDGLLEHSAQAIRGLLAATRAREEETRGRAEITKVREDPDR